MSHLPVRGNNPHFARRSAVRTAVQLQSPLSTLPLDTRASLHSSHCPPSLSLCPCVSWAPPSLIRNQRVSSAQRDFSFPFSFFWCVRPFRHILHFELTPLQITLHYIRNFSLGGGSSSSFGSQLTISTSRTSTERLNAPLREASNSDLLDLLNQRLGNVSVAEESTKYDARANAVLIMLSRNSEVNDAAEAVRQMEDRFNGRYHYPWVFLNDEPFSEEFIQCVFHILSVSLY